MWLFGICLFWLFLGLRGFCRRWYWVGVGYLLMGIWFWILGILVGWCYWLLVLLLSERVWFLVFVYVLVGLVGWLWGLWWGGREWVCAVVLWCLGLWRRICLGWCYWYVRWSWRWVGLLVLAVVSRLVWLVLVVSFPRYVRRCLFLFVVLNRLFMTSLLACQ